MIQFQCPACLRTIKSPDDLAGQMARCPHCRSVERVPGSPRTSPPVTLQPAQSPFVQDDDPPPRRSRRDDDRDDDDDSPRRRRRRRPDPYDDYDDDFEPRGRSYYQPPKSAGIAAILEVVGGFFQVFGLGNMYAGNIGVGLLFLFGYWFVAAFFFVVSILTCTGWLVLPMLWMTTLIVSICTATASCKGR